MAVVALLLHPGCSELGAAVVATFAARTGLHGAVSNTDRVETVRSNIVKHDSH